MICDSHSTKLSNSYFCLCSRISTPNLAHFSNTFHFDTKYCVFTVLSQEFLSNVPSFFASLDKQVTIINLFGIAFFVSAPRFNLFQDFFSLLLDGLSKPCLIIVFPVLR